MKQTFLLITGLVVQLIELLNYRTMLNCPGCESFGQFALSSVVPHTNDIFINHVHTLTTIHFITPEEEAWNKVDQKNKPPTISPKSWRARRNVIQYFQDPRRTLSHALLESSYSHELPAFLSTPVLSVPVCCCTRLASSDGRLYRCNYSSGLSNGTLTVATDGGNYTEDEDEDWEEKEASRTHSVKFTDPQEQDNREVGYATSSTSDLRWFFAPRNLRRLISRLFCCLVRRYRLRRSASYYTLNVVKDFESFV